MKTISKKVLLSCVGIFLLASSSTAWSANYWVTGKIVRSLTDSKYYGGCMIKLSDNSPPNDTNTQSHVANSCKSDGYVSLDCSGTYSEPGEGKQAYASALVALTLDKNVTLLVNNAQKHNGYCVARRLDMY